MEDGFVLRADKVEDGPHLRRSSPQSSFFGAKVGSKIAMGPVVLSKIAMGPVVLSTPEIEEVSSFEEHPIFEEDLYSYIYFSNMKNIISILYTIAIYMVVFRSLTARCVSESFYVALKIFVLFCDKRPGR